jgi:hypothetical protein
MSKTEQIYCVEVRKVGVPQSNASNVLLCFFWESVLLCLFCLCNRIKPRQILNLFTLQRYILYNYGMCSPSEEVVAIDGDLGSRQSSCIIARLAQQSKALFGTGPTSSGLNLLLEWTGSDHLKKMTWEPGETSTFGFIGSMEKCGSME